MKCKQKVEGRFVQELGNERKKGAQQINRQGSLLRGIIT